MLYVPEIPPKITGLVTLSWGGVKVWERPPCHSLNMSLLARVGGCLRQEWQCYSISRFFLTASLAVLLPGRSPDVWLPNIHVKVKRTKLSLGISKQILVWPGPSFYVIIKVSQVNILGAKYWVLSISRALLVYLAFRINELTCKGSKFSPGIPMNDSTIKGDKNKM